MSDKRLGIILEDNCIQGDRGELELAEAWAGSWGAGLQWLEIVLCLRVWQRIRRWGRHLALFQLVKRSSCVPQRGDCDSSEDGTSFLKDPFGIAEFLWFAQSPKLALALEGPQFDTFNADVVEKQQQQQNRNPCPFSDKCHHQKQYGTTDSPGCFFFFSSVLLRGEELLGGWRKRDRFSVVS